MTLTCKDIRSKDSQAAKLCDTLSSELSLTPQIFDRKTCKTDYSKKGAMPICEVSSLDPLNVYQQYLRIAPEESKTPKSTSVFSKTFGTKIPWHFDDKHKVTAERIISEIQKETESAGENKTYLVADALFRAFRSSRKNGGLEIVYKDHNEKEADINTTIDRRFVRCSEFQTLFFGFGKKLGLKMYLIEVPQVDSEGKDVPHAAVMIVDEKTDEKFFADYQFSKIFRRPPYKEYYVGTEADLFANFLYNRSMKKKGSTMKMSPAKHSPITLAEKVAPYNDVILYGLGLYHSQRGEVQEGIKYLRRAFETRPTHIPAMRAYCLHTFDMSICDKLLNQ